MTRLAKMAVTYAFERIHLDPPPLDGPRRYDELWSEVGQTITAEGLGADEALRVYIDHLAPTCISVDHPKHLSFVPAAPSEAAVIFDMVVSANGIYGGSWLEASGAIYAENQALRWLADLAGLPESAGGTFVSGGTAGNLSALIAARHRWRLRANGRHDRTRGLMLASKGAHSSVAQAARAMDCDVMDIPVDEMSVDEISVAEISITEMSVAEMSVAENSGDIDSNVGLTGQPVTHSHSHSHSHSRGPGRVIGDSVRRVIDSLSPPDRERLFAIVATAGTTNLGVVDELAAIGQVANECGVWFHVDGAYGAAALCAPSVRHLFTGIERSDSFVVDPHKWFFAPYDSCALIYRNIHDGRRAHTQHAEYLDVLHGDITDSDFPGSDIPGSDIPGSDIPDSDISGSDIPDSDRVVVRQSSAWLETNPADVAHHLSRRVRGLPFWFGLAVHGTKAYTEAMELTLHITREAAEEIRNRDYLELLMEPDLSIVVFRRRGWSAEQYQRWSDDQLQKGASFVTPTSWKGEPILRFCIVNPRTTREHIVEILDSLGD